MRCQEAFAWICSLFALWQNRNKGSRAAKSANTLVDTSEKRKTLQNLVSQPVSANFILFGFFCRSHLFVCLSVLFPGRTFLYFLRGSYFCICPIVCILYFVFLYLFCILYFSYFLYFCIFDRYKNMSYFVFFKTQFCFRIYSFFWKIPPQKNVVFSVSSKNANFQPRTANRQKPREPAKRGQATRQPREAAPKYKGASFPFHPYQCVSIGNLHEYCWQFCIFVRVVFLKNTKIKSVRLKIQLVNLYFPVLCLYLLCLYNSFVACRLYLDPGNQLYWLSWIIEEEARDLAAVPCSPVRAECPKTPFLWKTCIATCLAIWAAL